MEESYARAEGIVVAQVLGCADGAVPQNGLCPDHRYHLETIEVLKDPQPRQNFSGPYQGADGMTRCGQAFALGESYLLFFDESRSIISSAGGALNSPYPQSREIPHRIAALQDYRDGRLEELAVPWIFTDDSSCRLEQNVAGQQISFGYAHDDSQYDRRFRIEPGEDGNVRAKSQTQTPMGQMTTETVGPEIQQGSMVIAVRFHNRIKTEPDTATISVGDQMWNLGTLNTSIRRDGLEIAALALDVAQGNSAEEIFQAMLGPTDVIATKRGEAAAVRDGDPSSTGQTEEAVITTRSTQLAARADEFIACVGDLDR